MIAATLPAYHTTVSRTKCVTLESLNLFVARGMSGSSHVSHNLVQSIEGSRALPDVRTRVVSYLSPLVSMLGLLYLRCQNARVTHTDWVDDR